MALIKFSTPPTLAGFFFCLASNTVQGFSFCPAAREPHTSVYSAICIIHAIIQTKRKNRLQGFTAAFPFIYPIPAHTIQQPHKPPIRRLRSARGHTVKRCTSTNTRIPPPRRTLYRAGQPPIIIRYIRVQRCISVIDPCPAVYHSADHASGDGSVHPACIRCKGQPGGLRSGTGQQSGRTLHPTGQSSSRGAAGGTTGGLSPLLFSGCRPIANRGQE